MSSFQQLVSNGISIIEANNSSLSGSVTEFLRTQGINMNEIWKPAVDIIQSSSTITLYINIPGVKNDSIDVDFCNNKVIVTGERKKPFSDRTTVVKNEIIYGTFERQIIIPISVTNRDNVKITSKNGVLIIVIDKLSEEKNRFSLKISPNTE
jgi:HSP20 family protein